MEEETASGKFQFKRGQRRQKGSIRAKVLERVEKCPKHLNPVKYDPFKRKIKRHCGYHIPPVSQHNCLCSCRYILLSTE